MSGAGDVNGDGFADLIVGALGADPGGRDDAGGATWCSATRGGFGGSARPRRPSTAPTASASTASTRAIVSGRSVSGAGDVNGDGFADLIVGAPGADPGGDTVPARATWCSATRAASAARSTSPPSTAPTASASTASTRTIASGCSVSGAGDVNGDGFADLIVGASGADRAARRCRRELRGVRRPGRLRWRARSRRPRRHQRLPPRRHRPGRSLGLVGERRGRRQRRRLRRPDRRGFRRRSGRAIPAGESYVVFGDPGGFGGALDLAALDGTNGFRLDGIDPGDQLGPVGERRGRRQRRWLRRPDRRGSRRRSGGRTLCR